jgi:hypothetical protein
MKRIASAVVLAAALAGCHSDPPPPPLRSVIVYWSFVRHTQTAQGNVAYDTTDPGGGDASCADSGVDYVTVTEGGNVVNPELPQVPCTFQGVHGVVINGIHQGPHTWTITGYRNGGLPLYAGAQTFTVGGDTRIDVAAEGIPDDLDVNATFNAPRGGALPQQTCAGNGVGFLVYNLFDGANTLVATGDIPCPNPPGLTFRVANGTGVDRDVYTLRLQAFRDATSQTPVFDDQTTQLVPVCQASTFDHVAADVGPRAWTDPLYDVSNPAQQLCR